MTKTILIVGATGFLGEALGRYFLRQGYKVKGLTRTPQQTERLQRMQVEPILWDGRTLTGWEKELEGVETIIHLSGENIGSGSWTESKKKKILSSRVESGKLLVQALEKVTQKPTLFVQASAVGYYGAQADEEINEQHSFGQGFLAHVVTQWEESTQPVELMEIKRIVCRFGIVLGKEKGALKQIALPFRFFLGGKMGNGLQWMSWIHIDDLVQSLAFLIQQGSQGIYNITAPHPVRNMEFAKTLGKILKRPSFFTVPRFLLKLILGEMAQELLLSGQRVVPTRLMEAGFFFSFPTLEAALQNIYQAK